jgi:ribosomal protein L11 methyltransferase
VSAIWQVTARVRGEGAASAVFSVLDDLAGAVSAFESGAAEWRLEAYPQSPALTPSLEAKLALAAVGAGGKLLEIGEKRLPMRDWVAENQLVFPPQRVGRFFIYGSHYRDGVPSGAIGIAVDAATAFGTGEHASTRGCLQALERLGKRHRFRRLLDVGTGTGILSIAAAKLLRRKIIAGDIDQTAVDVARHNAERNGVARFVRTRRAAGYLAREFQKSRYDLVLSNILARPLAMMAADLGRTLAPGGRAVLSGLLRYQERVVLPPHRGCGIVLERRIVIDGWSTLVMHRPASGMRAKPLFPETGSAGSPLTPPYGGRAAPASEMRTSAQTTAQAFGHLRPAPRFANGEFQYQRASGRRAPSAGHRLDRAAATQKKLFGRKGKG